MNLIFTFVNVSHGICYPFMGVKIDSVVFRIYNLAFILFIPFEKICLILKVRQKPEEKYFNSNVFVTCFS